MKQGSDMQNVRFLKVNKSDLAWLFHTSEKTIKAWVKAGLKADSEGYFLLSDVTAFIKEQHSRELQARLDTTAMNQAQVTTLFGISRQCLFKWRRAGLSRTASELYDLKTICAWLRSHYQRSAKKEFQQRLLSIEQKLTRNYKQSLRFIERAKDK